MPPPNRPLVVAGRGKLTLNQVVIDSACGVVVVAAATAVTCTLIWALPCYNATTLQFCVRSHCYALCAHEMHVGHACHACHAEESQRYL